MVDYIRDGRRRLTPIGEMPILSGMLFCADCGAKLYQARVSELEAAIAEAREQRLNVDSFLGMVRRYTDITVDGGFRRLLPEITYATHEYDDVLNTQRQTIYAQRLQVLEGKDVKDNIVKMIDDTCADKNKEIMEV